MFDNYAGALGLYAWLGFPDERTIEFATTNAAAALGLADTTGTLAEGLAADLLVVAGDPLADLAALFDVRLVMTPNSVHEPTSTTAAKPNRSLHGSCPDRDCVRTPRCRWMVAWSARPRGLAVIRRHRPWTDEH
ncbi:MAG: amidohydrolase family protein [Pseudonocardiaceae bacterium]